MRCEFVLASFLLVSQVCACNGPEIDDDKNEDPDPGVWGQASLDAVTATTGTYEGQWELFGLDEAQATVTAATWTDTVISENPRIEGDRALVDVTDTLLIDGFGNHELSWIEGVLIEEDGAVGPAFMEMDGEFTLFNETEEGHIEYVTQLQAADYTNLANISQSMVISGQHTTYKVVTTEDGRETHNITRVTALTWDDGSGEQSIEFTSMEGYHQKMTD